MAEHLPAHLQPTEPVGAIVPAAAAPVPAPVYDISDDEEPGLDLQRILAALLRYRWIIVASAVLGTVAGFIGSRLQTPDYQAQATIWVEQGAGNRGPIEQNELMQNTNWLDLIKSFIVLDSVVRQQRLYLSTRNEDRDAFRSFTLKERFQPGAYTLTVDDAGRMFRLARDGAGVEQGRVGDSVGATVGFAWVPATGSLTAGRVMEFGVTSPRQAALTVIKNLDARLPQRDGNFIRLSLTGTSPVQTAATLNAIAEQFVEVAAVLKKEKLVQLRAVLEEQLRQSAAELRSAEIQLQTFQVGTITMPSDRGSPVAPGVQQTMSPALLNFFQMRTEAEQLRRDREAVMRVLSDVPDSAMSAVVLEAIPAVRAASEVMAASADLTSKQASLRALLTRYTDSNPQVQRLQSEIMVLQRQTLPNLLNGLLSDLRARETMLNGRTESAAREIREIPMRAIEEARLQREVVIAGNLYTTLQQRFSEAQLAERSSIPDVRVLDPAVVPDRPTRNLAPLAILAGLLGGLGLAVAAALLLDRTDRRLRYPDQVTRDLGLEIIGAIPRVRSGAPGDDGSAQVVEALRSIRLNLVNAYGSAGPLITAITSPGSGDGKSFLASNLALSFADAGHRTLLIDGDIRRGTLHRVLNVQRKPGLIDYLSGHADRERVIQHTGIASVDFIGCGTRRTGGPELLASPAMSQLLIGLRSQYSVIIIDSAPLGAGVDPLVLGSLTGNLLLVLRTGLTDRELAEAKLTDLNRLPIRVLGAVLNDVKPQGIYKYYSYLPGYAAGDEVEADPGTAAGRLVAKAD